MSSILLHFPEFHTHSPLRNCTLVMELNKNDIPVLIPVGKHISFFRITRVSSTLDLYLQRGHLSPVTNKCLSALWAHFLARHVIDGTIVTLSLVCQIQIKENKL